MVILVIIHKEREMDVVNSMTSGSDNTYSMRVSVITYGNVDDKEACAYEIIERMLDNDFQTILFSWSDRGYPYHISATVYKNERSFDRGEELFSFEYEAIDGFNTKYNMKDNPEQFELNIN